MWDTIKTLLTKDIPSVLRKQLHNEKLHLTKPEADSYVLTEIQDILKAVEKKNRRHSRAPIARNIYSGYKNVQIDS